MKHQAIDALGSRPRDDFLHEKAGDAAASPLRLGKRVHDYALPALTNGCITERPRQDRLQLNARPGDNSFRLIRQPGQPADIIAAFEPFFDACPSFGTKNLKCIRRHLAHVLEHPRAVPRNNASVLFGGATNSESVGHGRNGSTCDGQRPTKDTLRVNE